MTPATEESTPTRLATWSWVVYDLANTIFALGVVGLYFPAWLTSSGLTDSALSFVEAGAGVVVIFLAPWVGARTDGSGRRVPTLIVTTIAAVTFTSLLAAGPDWITLLALGAALVAFNMGSVVYDALLPDVSTPVTRGTVSGLGVGVGYVGSAIGLLIGTLAFDVWELGFSTTFRLLAGGFLVFALPSFLFIHEREDRRGDRPSLTDVISRLIRAWRLAATFPGMVRFLVGRFLYTDAINTLIGGFLAIYAIQELGLDSAQTRDLLIVAIAAAIPGSFLAGWAVRRLGALPVLKATLVAWIVALVAGVLAGVTDDLALAWVIGALGGAALGATWTADRVVMTDLSPRRHLGEMYGLYATVSRFATILGPLVWALIVDGLGLSRTVAMGALAAFVVAALVVISPLSRLAKQ